MKVRRSVGLALAGLVVAVLGVPLASAAASAHDSLLQADPAAGSTVGTAPTAVALTFSGDPLGGDGADAVEVIGPDKRYYEKACPALAGPLVTTPVALGPSGQYTVVWRIVSSDGHPVSSSFTFTYSPASATSGASGSAHPVCAAAGKAAAPAAATSGAPTGLWIGLGIGAAVVVAAGVLVWLLLRRPGADAEPDD